VFNRKKGGVLAVSQHTPFFSNFSIPDIDFNRRRTGEKMINPFGLIIFSMGFALDADPDKSARRIGLSPLDFHSKLPEWSIVNLPLGR
jgi:hypothetical protein